MSDIINLNKFRKARKRRDGESKAAENRVLHGRTKADKDRAKEQAMREQNELDGKKLATHRENEPDEPA